MANQHSIQPIVTRYASLAEAEAAKRAWWHSLSPAERLRQLELARQYAYGVEVCKGGKPRIPNISQRPWR